MKSRKGCGWAGPDKTCFEAIEESNSMRSSASGLEVDRDKDFPFYLTAHVARILPDKDSKTKPNSLALTIHEFKRDELFI